ncbi:hypothetical protein [Spirosoma endbachense]|uniref:Uncharacterized protein n=1 Tax=Spirosoma endbachense TaxID=2666025 RepID=A0A6P1VW33_9BACT|nr:hypothetical protein [Spirosoma endbachense]QHV96965.1 hypothetical protein GJR95_18995 [Spirosoma endbachense]
MEALYNDRKVWAKPTVQTLNINKDTYSSQGHGDREVGKGGGDNQTKDIPS